jgi:V/A-type H+/Na+-transporting ATPase subunit B
MKKVYNKILSIVGNVITVRAEGVSNEELAEVRTKRGSSLAKVIKIDRDLISLQVFSGSRGVSTNDEVRFLGNPMKVSFSENMLGRIFDGSGKPRDKGPALTENLIEIGGPSVNPSKRIIPKRMIRTNIPMIDVFNSLVVSQKLPIFSVSGEPYNQLLARIALQTEVDMIVLGGIGLKYDEYMYFKNELEKGGALNRSIFFMHTAADPVVEGLMVPDLCLAVGEQFALNGKDVLVLLTDMTNFADSLKEIAITMEQVPSNRGYPGDLYTQLATRYEKAVDFEGAGSLTVLAATTMPGDDVTHPVPDNTGYITEGQFYLRNGRIEPFGSLSRLKQQVNADTREDHRAIMDGMIQLYAQYQETEEKRSMGFRMSSWDKKLLKYGGLFEKEMMDLSVNISLEDALDKGWQILAECFEQDETSFRTELIRKFWPSEKEKNLGSEDKEESPDTAKPAEKKEKEQETDQKDESGSDKEDSGKMSKDNKSKKKNRKDKKSKKKQAEKKEVKRTRSSER